MGISRGRRGADDGRRSDWIGPVVVGAYRTRIVRPIVGLAGRVRGVGAVDGCTVGLVTVPWTDAGPARSDAAAHRNGYGTAAEGARLHGRRGAHDRCGEQQGGANGTRRGQQGKGEFHGSEARVVRVAQGTQGLSAMYHVLMAFSGSLHRFHKTKYSANSACLSTLCLWVCIPPLAHSLLSIGYNECSGLQRSFRPCGV